MIVVEKIKKFESLNRRTHKRKNNDFPIETVVIKRSSVPLTEEETKVLVKGLNYAVAPKKFPKEEIICEVEAVIRRIPAVKAEEVRQDIARVLKTATPPKSNLTMNERRALRTIREKPDIIILPTDKGNATVVMDRKEYDDKIKSLLDPATYKKIKKDPIEKIVRKMKELVKTTEIPADQQESLFVQAPVPPRIYGLLKIHKPALLSVP
nr:uncharacterized protein LOC111415639 [Onthophagus taurus]